MPSSLPLSQTITRAYGTERGQSPLSTLPECAATRQPQKVPGKLCLSQNQTSLLKCPKWLRPRWEQA